MKVFKFGGASVKDAAGIANVARILQSSDDESLIVVVSAMGKTTNALEKLLSLTRRGEDGSSERSSLQHFHATIMQTLFPPEHDVFSEVDTLFQDLDNALQAEGPYDKIYDNVVAFGELISTTIINHYLVSQGASSLWIDARDYVQTDETHREAKVDWQETRTRMQALADKLRFHRFLITQGFIGKSPSGVTTTLGRDGADFTAAIFAACVGAKSVTIWKDVPGVMNADPKRIPTVRVFPELPYREAAEMTYYGASVIHPKTIQPLATQGIPLYVKNFDDPTLPGTMIYECRIDNLPPLIVFKDNQCLVSCKVTDYTFITEDHLRLIFATLTDLNIRINVMQNSAISFSFCFDFRESKLRALVARLQPDFEVYYNTGLTLVTIKNYDSTTVELYRKQSVLMEQSSRTTFQILLRAQ